MNRLLLIPSLLLLAACGRPPPSSGGAASARETATHSVEARGLTLAVPPSWQSEAPTSSMRAAQLRVPGETGEARCTVFHFGVGGGGPVADNLARWRAHWEGAAEGEAGQQKVGTLTVHRMDLAGTYVAPKRPMDPSDRYREKDWRGIYLIVEGPGGPWFLTLIGPAATVGAAEADVDALVEALALSR